MADKSGSRPSLPSFDENGMTPFTSEESTGFSHMLHSKVHIGHVNPYVTIVIKDAETGATSLVERIPELVF